MAIKCKNVLEVILFEYAKLIADAAVEQRARYEPAARAGSEYWSFVAMIFRKLVAGKISPSSVLRENQLVVAVGQECAYCGKTGALQWEHIIPRARGGPDTFDNMVLSCASCNSQKSSKNPVDWYRQRGLNRKHVPRLVMGKLLKLVLDEHRRRGTLADVEFPPGQSLSTSQVCRVFEYPDGDTNAGTRG
ncbi:HNH endonuclease [Sorangium sp. So ce406]|uniref:HNH endonuclease n=1 Tax=Sorangium sp. So ce406 TaxID=3133311 RepID=UPI003F5B17F1